MKKVIILAFIILSSCSTFKESNVDTHKIKIDMASVNKVMRGRLYRGKMKGDLSKIDVPFYMNNAKENQAHSETEYFEFLENYKPEAKLKATKKDFVICLKSLQAKLVICDVASTAMTDFDSMDININLEQKILDFKLSN